MLVRVVPGALAVVFLICLTSFAVALTLGGGPRATTLELAIYQAFRFDFDLGRMALLAALSRRWPEAIGMTALVSSPLVIGAGLFVMVHPFDNPSNWVVPISALVNAAMALPFAMRAIVPAARRAEADFTRLSQSLGLSPRAHWRLVLWPRLRRPAGFALGLGAALSMGDLGVIVLFAQTDGATLPMQLHRLMGAYRSDAAAGRSCCFSRCRSAHS